jgi:hypothetical protein
MHDLYILVNIASRPKVSFGDDCSIYYITRDRNIVSLVEDNFLSKVELKLNQPHMMLWAHMVATHMVATHMFDHCNLAVPVNAACYVELLDVRLIPHLRDKRNNGRYAPAHIILSVQEVLNKQCLCCCSSTSPVSSHRPPRVPDLITRVKSLLLCYLCYQGTTSCAVLSQRWRVAQGVGLCLHCYKVTSTSAYATRNTAVHVQVYLMCSNSRELVKKIVFLFEVRSFPGHSFSSLRVLMSRDVGRQAGSAVRHIIQTTLYL